MIEHGPAHGMHWARSIVMLTTNVGVQHSKRIAEDRAKVRAALYNALLSMCQ